MITKGHIYKIICNLDNSFCYIGSTFRTLNKRFEEHKNRYKNNYGEISIHKYFYQYGIDNFKIELIKSYNVIRIHQTDFKHLHAYETLWINTKNCINKQLPFNPLTNILKNEYHKEYYQDNKKELIEKAKEYRDNNKKEIAEQKKQHYEKNKKEIAEKQQQHYQKNKKEINEKKKQKFTCECGSTVRLSDKARHFKSKKHIKFLENK